MSELEHELRLDRSREIAREMETATGERLEQLKKERLEILAEAEADVRAAQAELEATTEAYNYVFIVGDIVGWAQACNIGTPGFRGKTFAVAHLIAPDVPNTAFATAFDRAVDHTRALVYREIHGGRSSDCEEAADAVRQTNAGLDNQLKLLKELKPLEALVEKLQALEP